jgi:hypothetical protein
VIFEVIAALSDCTFINKRETSYAKSNKLDQFKKKILQETPAEKFLDTFSEGNDEREDQVKA